MLTMDYHFFGLAKFICILLTLLPTIYASHYDRDIILTPNKTQQHVGKIIYFKPFDKSSSASKQRSLKENVQTTQVPWEEPLKHATYLVLNNKIDGNDNSSEFVNETQLQTATYVRGSHKSYQKFGDIVSLARGRLEADEDKNFVFIEMDRNECKKLNCSLNGDDDKNITAFWLVEKLRHRDEKQGHRYELRITIFPIKKYRAESKRDATENQPKRRSFVIREQDYPKYFDESMKPSSKIQKRFFDLVGSLSERPFEQYEIPFSVGRYQNRYPDDLNTGEYYHPKRNGEQYYQRPVATTSSYGGHVQFPDAITATNDFLEATRTYPISPFTSTHLHHHYYLNRNNVPLIKATGFEKETVYEDPSGDDYRTQVRVRNPQIEEDSSQIHQQPDQSQSNKQQEPNASPQNNPIPTAVGIGYNFYTEQPHNVYEVSDSSGNIFGNHQHLQTPYSLSEQVPAPPLQFGQFYQQNHPYNHPLQLQVATPPQQYLVNGLENAPITTAPFSLRQQQYQLEQFRPIIDYPSRFNRQQFPIQSNDVNVNYNQQFEPNRYSEPDPIYHGENIPLAPYTRQVGFDPVIDIGNHQQQATSAPKPTENSNQNQEKPEKQTELKNDEEEYEINPVNVRKRPERQRAKTQSKSKQQQQQPDRTENQTKYPDSINAQLPPPEQDDDLTVPYVESSVITQTSLIQSTSAESNDYSKHSTNYEKPRRVRPRGYYGPRTTTEKPILKWMPKKTKPKGSITIIEDADESASTASPVTTEAIVTVTPVNNHSEEPRTSVSTSISVQVGSNSAAPVLSHSKQTTRPTNSSSEPKESEEFTGFLPTVIPNVELVRGIIEAVRTNQSNLKLFRSGEIDDNDAEEDHIAQSIITHARGL
ncbi:uncharacterized protein LOC119084313 [Bradysia coprophila]|uniref:uncharacterized protein LOC119084313 n=1 Tax=Bradysia coprophila TaxID=38358 RepID=UPI00187DBBD3|nr:uncharacterized protein LOC119084313 [Bradysia coprophila]